jgi:hypothetical protein
MTRISKQGEFAIAFKDGKHTVLSIRYSTDSGLEMCAYKYNNRNTRVVATGSGPEILGNENPVLVSIMEIWECKVGTKLTEAQLARLNAYVVTARKGRTPYIESVPGKSMDIDHMAVLALEPHVATVEWETDGESLSACGLSRKVILPFDLSKDEVEEWLSGTFGFCVTGFTTNF